MTSPDIYVYAIKALGREFCDYSPAGSISNLDVHRWLRLQPMEWVEEAFEAVGEEYAWEVFWEAFDAWEDFNAREKWAAAKAKRTMKRAAASDGPVKASAAKAKRTMKKARKPKKRTRAHIIAR